MICCTNPCVCRQPGARVVNVLDRLNNSDAKGKMFAAAAMELQEHLIRLVKQIREFDCNSIASLCASITGDFDFDAAAQRGTSSLSPSDARMHTTSPMHGGSDRRWRITINAGGTQLATR